MISLREPGTISPVVLDPYGRAIVVAWGLSDGTVRLEGGARADDQWGDLSL